MTVSRYYVKLPHGKWTANQERSIHYSFTKQTNCPEWLHDCPVLDDWVALIASTAPDRVWDNGDQVGYMLETRKIGNLRLKKYKVIKPVHQLYHLELFVVS